MATDQQVEQVLALLERIAKSLEAIATVVDKDADPPELNVYVTGEMSVEEEDDDDDDDDDDD